VAIDIFRLDRITGEGIFIKSGAAPSYIKRDGALFRIRSATMPIGVLRNIDAEKIRSRVGRGDVIFMMSDGISGVNEAAVREAKYDANWDGGADAPWLIDMLNSFNAEATDIPKRIVEGAAKNNTHPDDMTVIVGCVVEIKM
jgi:stage II sporulation protein E